MQKPLRAPAEPRALPERRESARLDLAGIVGPMEKRLALARPAVRIPAGAILLQLGDVPPDRAPSFDLPDIVRMTPSRIVAAIPLEPPPRVVRVDPPFVAPNFERLGCADAKVIEFRPWPIRGKLGAAKPARRKFIAAIGHVLAAENAERQHLARGQFRREPGTELFSNRLRSPVGIIFLHSVFDDNLHWLHPLLLAR